MRIILASTSPRRVALMKQARIDVEIVSPNCEELLDPGESPSRMVRRLAIEKAGYEPIRKEMEAIDGIKDMKGVLAQVAKMQIYGASPMFGFYAGQDPKNSEVVVPQLMQGGITLPDRDYYVKDDARSKDIRKEYLGHITKMFSLIGTDA